MRASNELVLSVADGTSGTTNGSPIPMENVFALSVQSVSTGDCTGTLKLQASNDPVNLAGGPVNWTDISGASLSVTAASKLLLPKLEVSYQWIRATYTGTGGATGGVSARMKSIGT